MVLPGHQKYMDKRPFHNTHTCHCYRDIDYAHYSRPHTLWGCAVRPAAELASALTAAADLTDAAVTPTVFKMT